MLFRSFSTQGYAPDLAILAYSLLIASATGADLIIIYRDSGLRRARARLVGRRRIAGKGQAGTQAAFTAALSENSWKRVIFPLATLKTMTQSESTLPLVVLWVTS